jgi:hypothetical protein
MGPSMFTYDKSIFWEMQIFNKEISYYDPPLLMSQYFNIEYI